MVALANHRNYAYHSVGALGVIEMTAPTRAGYVDRGLRRLGIPAKKRHYFGSTPSGREDSEDGTAK